jgi:hypothetical protein
MMKMITSIHNYESTRSFVETDEQSFLLLLSSSFFFYFCYFLSLLSLLSFSMKNFQSILSIYKAKKDLPDSNGPQLLSPNADRIRSMDTTQPKDLEDDEREAVDVEPSFDGVRNGSADQFQSDHHQQPPNRSFSSDEHNEEERENSNQLNEREQGNLLMKAKHGLHKDKTSYQLQKEGLKKAFQSSLRKKLPKENVLLKEDNYENAQPKDSKLKQRILHCAIVSLLTVVLLFVFVRLPLERTVLF